MTQPLASRQIAIDGRDVTLSGIAGDAYFNGANIDSESDFVRFVSELLPDNGVFLDIGANIGLTSLIAAVIKPQCSIIAIEAAPTIAEIARQNLVRNNVCLFELHNVAAGSSDGHISFIEHSAYGHIIDSRNFIQAGMPHAPISVPVRRADDIVGDRNIDLVKIDVEGFEETVLAGITATEARCRPAYFIEFNAWTLSAFGRVNPMDFMERMLGRFEHISCLNEHGTWTRVDVSSCIHVVFRGFQGQVTNLVCSNDEKKVLL